MDSAKTFSKEKGWGNRISFKKTPKVLVKLISDEKKTIQDDAGKDVEGILIKVLQDGEEKEIFTSSASLISQLVDYEPNDVVVIEMKRNKTPAGYRSSFVVSKPKANGESEEEIPVIEDNEEGIDVKDIPF